MKKKSPYIHDTNIHNGESAKEIVPILMELFKPKSVIDLGCGLGDWLYAFKKCGVEEILGVDGDWVNRSNSYIDKNHFQEANLTEFFQLNRKFDLAISLEVAEHLPESAADNFVKTLVSLSDKIVFSAAIPGQGGQNHINEQWHDYWISKFEEHGFYCHDIIRTKIWNNPKVDYWYAQNLFFFIKNKDFKSEKSIINVIHPVLFEHRNQQIRQFETGLIGVRPAFSIFIKAVKSWIKKQFKYDSN